ncbi:nuclear transport factor 2 family protein [Congregibacter brevis]|uniref:Nuclear transport factor 2 family protein n=1 Tax=Congregibacter brevis TaxID=3081201 RepID=A0ABZ0IBY2_9GAMM|nr:nuclear transport factor 2 family protein [Congregibacter sp. IMCC45268]
MNKRFRQMQHPQAALLCVLSAVLLILSQSVRADDMSAVRSTVFDYFEGINEVSFSRLQRAFSETAELKSVSESGELVAEPIEAAINRWMKGKPQEREGRILSVDLSGDPIARVVFDFDGAYVDFLTLAKLRGEWKIIDKVYIRSPISCCEANK